MTTRVGLSEERTYLFMSKEPLAGAVVSHGLVARGCLSFPVSCSCCLHSHIRRPNDSNSPFSPNSHPHWSGYEMP